MNEAIKFLSTDFCIRCKKQAIKIVDIYNRKYDYSELLKNTEQLSALIDNVEFSHFECDECHEVYAINWATPGYVPIPLLPKVTEIKIEGFTEDFINGGSK